MLEKEKILYVITKGNFGGAQRYVYDLATNLPKDRFSVAVACGIKDGEILIQKLSEKNIRTIVLESSEREMNFKKDFSTFKDLIKIIREEKPNVVHFNSSKIGVLGSLTVLYLRFLNLFSFILRTSYLVPHAIFTSHGWAFKEQGRSAFSKIIFYLGHYLTVLICNQTIAVSAKTKKDMACLPFIKNKIKIIYNGIDKFKSVSKKQARTILANQNEDKTVIFSVAELHKNKGIDVAFKALSLLPQAAKEKIIYCLAGNGDEKNSLEKLAAELNIHQIVRFLGFVPNAKTILTGADIFLLPSRTENLPYAILEAGLTGLPIIATSVGGIPEIIKDMQNGILVHPQNPKEIAEGILYLLDHQDKQKEFGEEIKKTVVNFFSLEKMLEETEKIYKLP